jgi:hypothetical protein
MFTALRCCFLILVAGTFLAHALAGPPAPVVAKQEGYWQVEEVRAGMKGQGRTVMKGTKIETFDAEVLGVLKNVSPGRDMVLCRLSGLALEKTGVIAGMSGSPIYIQGKLLGAVAYAWPFGKEPIAGITPFAQMLRYVAPFENREVAEEDQPRRIGLNKPLQIGDREFDTVTVTNDYRDPQPTAADGMWMVPLRTPLAATGFTPGSLALLRNLLHDAGMVPMQGGGVSGSVAEREKDAPLLPGSALTVAMVQGDFDLSGIGTVTHVDGKRVYGWGHPFFGLGACDFPLMTGYVHTIYPRQSLSFKMGSPLQTVGVINADVSTCIAGVLGGQPDLLPLRMTVVRSPDREAKTFNVKIVRQRSMIGSLVFTVLANSVDMEGELPEELTAHLKATVEIEGRPPVIIHDTFSGSGFTGGRAPQALFQPVSAVVNLLTFNPYRPIRIKSIDCATEVVAGRRTADIESIELESDTFAPGDTLKAMVSLRPYKGLRQRLPVSLALPPDLPEGTYTATVGDDVTSARQQIRDNPNLSNPQNLEHVFDALKVQTSAKRANLVVRVPLGGTGVALEGQSLPDLPPGMVQILSSGRRTGAQPMNGALVSRRSTAWVIQGSDSVRFTVSKHKKVIER